MEIAEEINTHFLEGKYGPIIEQLKQSSVIQLLGSDSQNDTQFLFRSLILIFNGSIRLCHSREIPPEELSILDSLIYECARLLRNSCANGLWERSCISNSFDADELFICVRLALNLETMCLEPKTRKMCWQLLANTTVLNVGDNIHFFRHFRDDLYGPQRSWRCPCECGNARECTMILYNIFRRKGGVGDDAKLIIEFILGCYDLPSITEHDSNNEFHHIFFEYLISSYGRLPYEFVKLDSAKRLSLLYYVADHMRSPSHVAISNCLLMIICDEFKKKSDCVLKTTGSYVDGIEPKEVVALLDVLAQASSDERYSHILSGDGSLFLNVGCLLQTINTIGSGTNGGGSGNIFTPVQKLGQLAPNSEENTNIERDISYQLKSTLVRTLGNLAYKNSKNQALAREMDILMAVLNSTVLDARNPLIKEWSILAIRNLCENNAENQQIIRQLTKLGDADNSDILKELNIDMGSLRIGPK